MVCFGFSLKYLMHLNIFVASLTQLINNHPKGNRFEGPLPDEFGDLTNLQYTRWQTNLFNDTGIPTTIGQMTDLYELWMFSCYFNGTLPTELGGMTSLADLRVRKSDLSQNRENMML
jgi:hypothetical protein